MRFKFSRSAALLVLAALVPACGGSGSGSGFVPSFPGAWARTYGGASSDLAGPSAEVVALPGAYAIAGRLNNNSLGWVLLLNLDGSIAWQKSYATSGTTLMSMDAAPGVGMIFAATTTALGATGADIWVVLLNSDGSIAWQKRYGGPGNDYANRVRATSDGGFIVLGGSTTFSGSVQNLWILKLNADGSVAWQKTLVNAIDQYPTDIREVPGGGYIVTSQCSVGASFLEACVLRLNANGTIAWQQRYGTTDNETFLAVTSTSDSGFLMSGLTYLNSAGAVPYGWVVKTDANGTLGWQKKYGSGVYETFTSCEALADGTFALTGVESAGAGSAGSKVWAVRLNADASVAWQKRFGGGSAQDGATLTASPYGGFTLLGNTTSYGAGSYDLWMLHLDDDGSCGSLGTDTSVTSTDTTATATVTTFVVADTTVTPVDTAVVPVNTFYVSTQQVP